MPLSWNSIFQQEAAMLGNLLATTITQAEASYTATMSNSTLKGPDFIKSVLQDATAATLHDIVTAIAETPFHPERTRYADTLNTVASGSILGVVGASGGARIIGIPGRIIDSSDSIPLIAKNLDDVRSFNRFKAAGSVYAGKNEYWFAFYDKSILHTRTSVTIAVCGFDRPSSFSGNVNLADQFENLLVMGTVRRLAPKEGMYIKLFEEADLFWNAGIADIKAHGASEAWGVAQAAPSTT